MAATVVVLSVGILTACTSPDRHAPLTGVVHGEVAAYGGMYGAPSGPVPGHTVTLVDAGGHVVVSTRTNSTGDYTLTVKPGPYRVVGDVCSQAVHEVTVVAGRSQELNLFCYRR